MKYKIIVDKQSRTNPSEEKREYEVDIEELRTRRNVYDSIVITRDEAYVLRKFTLSDLMVLSELEEPIKEPLQDLNIELFEGDNYIYLIDMIGNKFYAEYLIKNEFNELYVTLNQMNSAINQTAENIELTVNQKLEGYSTTKEMNSAINQSAENIQLTVNQKLEDYSTTEEMNATIEVTANEINSEVSKKVGKNEIISRINQSAETVGIKAQKIELSASDILNLIAGNTINLSSKKIMISSNCFNVNENGIVTLKDSESIGSALQITSADNSSFNSEIRSFGANFNGPNGFVRLEADFAYSGGVILVAPSETESSNYTMIQNGTVNALTISQRSLEKVKKNIEKPDINAVELIKNSDIYAYNLKSEEDTDKKHIGFVIGDKYNTPNEVIAKSGEGIDTYSMSSIMWKAIQELTARVEQLEKEVANGKN